ncbi:hypothetical protein N2152v2_002239 [Parachlorella kessleri]
MTPNTCHQWRLVPAWHPARSRWRQLPPTQQPEPGWAPPRPQQQRWRQQRRARHRPRSGNSMRDIGDDLREIREDLMQRLMAGLNGNKRPRKAPGSQQQPQLPPGKQPQELMLPGSVDGNGAGPPPPGRPSALTDWSGAAVDEDWDSWQGSTTPDLDDEDDMAELKEQIIERRRRRQGKRTRVRDEYLRPIVDAQGIYNRLTYDEREAEERVFVEAITNQYESKEALTTGAVLVAVPLLIGFVVSRLIAEPLWTFAEGINPQVFDLTDEQKVEGANEIKLEEMRVRMEASIGRAPPLTDEVMLLHLAKEAHHIAEEMREGNKRALLNVVSDSTSAGVFFLMLLRNTAKRQILFRTIGRVFSGLSDTAKAFLIILVTDILLGYHSEEGWTAFLKLFSRHYGVEPELEGIYVFVSTVPVILDTCFKYWIFVGLNKEDPAAAVTLRQMDRH